MFILPSKYHLLGWLISHYRGRLSEAKTVKEFNFLSERLHHFEQINITTQQ